MIDPQDLPKPLLVNNLAVHGFLNGILNLAFTAANWYPVPDPNNPGQGTVAIHEPVVLDLRMDLMCAQQLRDALDKIIEQNTKPKVMDS